jgi:hypothetical protein
MTATTLPPRRGANAEPADLPWWRHAMVWLVISGPLAVLIAGFVTLWIAWTHIDPVLDEPAARAAAQRIPSGADAPAQAARNHAATPQR